MTWEFKNENFALTLGNGHWLVEEPITSTRINVRKCTEKELAEL